MVKLIFYEYRKNFLKLSIIIAIFLFPVLNIVKIHGIYTENSLFARGYDARSSELVQKLYWKMYKNFGGEITKDKIKRLMSIYHPIEEKTADQTASTAGNNPGTYTGNIYNDYFFFDKCFVKPMEYCYMYRSYANSVTTAAKDNMKFYQSVGNTYEYRKNAAIADIFKGRRVKDFAFTEMYQYYSHYDFSSVLVLLICLYGLVGVFVSEKETDMDVLLLSAKSGGNKTVAAKIISSVIFICLVCLWFWVTDFLTFACIFGSAKGAFAPLYAIENFSNTAVNLNILQYAALSGIVKTFGMLVLGMGILLLSCLFRNALMPYVIGLSAALGLIYSQSMLMGSGYIFRKTLNPFVLMVNRELFRKTEFANVLGFPVASYVLALVFAALWGAAFFIGIVKLVRKNTVTRRRAAIC